MKIVVLGKYNFKKQKGGIEKYVKELVKDLKEKNELLVLFSSTSKHYKIEKNGNVTFVEISKLFEILEAPFTKPFFGYLNYFKPEVIWMHIPNPFWEIYLLFYFLLHKKECCLIATYHADAPHYTLFSLFADILRHFFLLPLLSFFDGIIATTKEYATCSIPLKLFFKKVLFYPIKIDESSLTKYEKPKFKIKKPFILFIGRLFKYKGLEYLLEAFSKIERKGKKVNLVIAGSGPLRKRLEILTEKLNLKNVKFFGRVSDKEKNYLLKNCELFVLPSINRGEAFGISMVEAMYFSKPIISTRIKGSGVTFVNKHMQTGIVVEPKNSEELAKAILLLLNNKKLREKLGKNARKRAFQFFIKTEKEKYFLKILKETIKVKCKFLKKNF